jgi:hypothetical protein
MTARFLVSQTARRAHRTIASALRAAAGSRRDVLVEIEPGRYLESLIVDGAIELAAADGPDSVVISSDRSPAVETRGDVRLTDLVLASYYDDAVRCRAGLLTVEGSRVQSAEGIGVRALPDTTVNLRHSILQSGRVLYRTASGTIEDCRFENAVNNAVAAIDDSDVRIRDSRIENSRIHGVLASGSKVLVDNCDVTGTGDTSIAADKHAVLTVTNCRITAVHAAGVLFAEQSSGRLENTEVTDANQGVAVRTGAVPAVRGCTFTRCRDAGIMVHEQGLGRFEDCDVVDAGNVAVFSGSGGNPSVDDCRISGGNVGIAVLQAQGEFAGCDISDVGGVALRVWKNANAKFSGVAVTGCPAGFEARGGGGTLAELTDTDFRQVRLIGVTALEQARVKLTNCTIRHGLAGLSAGDEAQLLAHGCRVEHTEAGGAIVYGRATFRAERLIVAHPGAYGLRAQGTAYFDVRDSEFTDTRYVGVSAGESCAGRLERCSVTGDQGASVVENGRVQTIELRSSLPVLREAPEPPPEISAQLVNFGLIFNHDASGAVVNWGNETVSQHLTLPEQARPGKGTAMSDSGTTGGPAEPDEPQAPGAGQVYNYGTMFNHAVTGQVAWDNVTVTQNQTNTGQVAPGFEEVARAVAAVLERLADLGLPEPDARDAAEHGAVVLAEVARPEPDRGVIRRGLAGLKGALAQLAAGLVSGANEGAVEVGKQLVRSLGDLTF